VNARDIDITGEDGRPICAAALADRPHTRLRGLMGRRALPADGGLLIKPAPSIHTFFMRFAIDAVFLDRELRVVGIEPGLRPWRIAGRRGARAVLELPAGSAARRGMRAGELLRIARAGGS
jgi:uncharacterized membrane protein (UPF0127 family)